MTDEPSVHLDDATDETAEVIADLARRVEELSQELLATYGREEILIKQVDALQIRQQRFDSERITDAGIQRKLESLEAENADLRFELTSARVAAAATDAELRALLQTGTSTSEVAKTTGASHGSESVMRRRYRQLRRTIGRAVRGS